MAKASDQSAGQDAQLKKSEDVSGVDPTVAATGSAASQLASQPASQLTGQPASQPTGQAASQPTGQPASQSIGQAASHAGAQADATKSAEPGSPAKMSQEQVSLKVTDSNAAIPSTKPKVAGGSGSTSTPAATGSSAMGGSGQAQKTGIKPPSTHGAAASGAVTGAAAVDAIHAATARAERERTQKEAHLKILDRQVDLALNLLKYVKQKRKNMKEVKKIGGSFMRRETQTMQRL